MMNDKYKVIEIVTDHTAFLVLHSGTTISIFLAGTLTVVDTIFRLPALVRSAQVFENWKLVTHRSMNWPLERRKLVDVYS